MVVDNNNNDNADNYNDAWDRLCIDPHQTEINEGRAEGVEAGEKAGFQEGYKLGRTTAMDYGMEIGFIHGCSRAIARTLRNDDDTSQKSERAKKSLRLLEQALAEFPSANDIFSSATITNVPALPAETNDEDDVVEDGEESHIVERPEDTDVAGKLQRIRARFKMLTMQLGIPHVSLQKAMAQVSSDHDDVEDDSGEQEIKTTEW